MAREHSVAANVFGRYDVRGRYPEEFSPDVCRRIADALASSTRRSFVIARDSRTASARLATEVVRRLRADGRPVLELGVQPTPVVGFASSHLRLVGLAFTPSHNPVGYAGVKAFAPSGRAYADEWATVRRAFERRARPGRSTGRGAPGGRGPGTAPGVLEAYLDHVTAGQRSRQEVVVDGRGGATTRIAPRALRAMGATVRELHPEFSARFHGRSPEPLPENVRDLGRRVRATGAAFGVAFDGDGDRVVFVDEGGHWVEPEVIGTFLHHCLSSPGRPLVASADASQRCESEAPTVRSRVGSRYLTATMRRHRSEVGFEASSHFYLRRWGPNSDGILTACVVADLLDRRRTTLGRLRRSFGPIVRDRQVLDFPSRLAARRHVRELIAALRPTPERGIDGHLLRTAEGTVLFRLSNTQPSVRLTFEPRAGGSLAALRRTWARAVRSAR